MPCFVSCRYPVGAYGGYQSGAKCRELPREFMCCFALSAKVFADWRSVWRRAAHRRRAGQRAAGIHVMPCSESCRHPVGAYGGYQSGAKWRELPREFMCCFALSAKVFADWSSVSRRRRRRYGCATKYVLQDSIRLLRCGDGSLSPWTFSYGFSSYGYSVYDCSGSCKDPGHRAYAAKSVCQFYMPILSGSLTKGRDNRWKSR